MLSENRAISSDGHTRLAVTWKRSGSGGAVRKCSLMKKRRGEIGRDWIKERELCEGTKRASRKRIISAVPTRQMHAKIELNLRTHCVPISAKQHLTLYAGTRRGGASGSGLRQARPRNRISHWGRPRVEAARFRAWAAALRDRRAACVSELARAIKRVRREVRLQRARDSGDNWAAGQHDLFGRDYARPISTAPRNHAPPFQSASNEAAVTREGGSSEGSTQRAPWRVILGARPREQRRDVLTLRRGMSAYHARDSLPPATHDVTR